jgi:hypothetical protein
MQATKTRVLIKDSGKLGNVEDVSFEPGDLKVIIYMDDGSIEFRKLKEITYLEG